MRVFVVDVSDWWAQPIAVYKHEHDSLKNDVLLMPWLYVMCVYVPRFFFIIRCLVYNVRAFVLTLIFHYTSSFFLLSHSHHRQLILEIQKSLLR